MLKLAQPIVPQIGVTTARLDRRYDAVRWQRKTRAAGRPCRVADIKNRQRRTIAEKGQRSADRDCRDITDERQVVRAAWRRARDSAGMRRPHSAGHGRSPSRRRRSRQRASTTPADRVARRVEFGAFRSLLSSDREFIRGKNNVCFLVFYCDFMLLAAPRCADTRCPRTWSARRWCRSPARPTWSGCRGRACRPWWRSSGHARARRRCRPAYSSHW